jgi:glycosyltransferase involved in cell wall biosynthesis
MTPPDVDVLIPVRDGARFLPACLDSVFAQTFPARGVIVVDDGSIDETPRILADYAARRPNLQVIASEPRGVSHARNLALAASRAPFVAFLDSDDIWQPDKLAKQMVLFAPDRTQPGFVHCAYFCLDEHGRRVAPRRSIKPRKRGDIFADLLEGHGLSGSASAVVARRDLVTAAGGFDEKLFLGEDWDLWIRMAKLSHVDFVAEPLAGIRVHAGGSQHQRAFERPEVFLLERLRIVEKWVDQVPDDGRILDRYRIEAVRVAAKNVLLRFPPRWGLLRRLRASDVPLARRLFPTRRAYAQSFLRALAEAARGALANARAALAGLRGLHP